MKTVVLDASALLTYLEDQPGAARVEDLLSHALQKRCDMLMSVVNWGEICYSSLRSHGPEIGQRVEAQIARLPIRLSTPIVLRPAWPLSSTSGTSCRMWIASRLRWQASAMHMSLRATATFPESCRRSR